MVRGKNVYLVGVIYFSRKKKKRSITQQWLAVQWDITGQCIRERHYHPQVAHRPGHMTVAFSTVGQHWAVYSGKALPSAGCSQTFQMDLHWVRGFWVIVMCYHQAIVALKGKQGQLRGLQISFHNSGLTNS